MLAQRWRLLVERLPIDGFVKGLARNCVLREQGGADWQLELTVSAQYLLKPDRVEALQNAVVETHGEPVRLVMAVAEYNGGATAVLKNAIDWASRPAFASVFKDKPCLVVSVSGGASAAARLRAAMIRPSRLSPRE
mgnify:CR=1 FL=1